MTTTHSYQHLNDLTVRIIARRYELDANEAWVRAEATQADNYGTSLSSAAELLDGYLAETARVMCCDALAHRDFENEAYGR